MANKPSIVKGTRDFGPQEMAKRNYIFNTIRLVYELYGFQQIETPAQETLQTLMGKYGEEGDKLLFKILNSGDYLSKVTDNELIERNTLHLASKVCEKGLRYDLTVLTHQRTEGFHSRCLYLLEAIELVHLLDGIEDVVALGHLLRAKVAGSFYD